MITVYINLTDIADSDYIDEVVDKLFKLAEDSNCELSYDYTSYVLITLWFHDSDEDIENAIMEIQKDYPIVSVEFEWVG